MNTLDKLIGWFSPRAGLQRAQERALLGQVSAHYEAAEPSRLRKFRTERGSQNEQVQRGAGAVRAQVRHLARNHDLGRGALRVLVNNVIGPKGIGVEPQPRRADGTIHTEYAKALLEAWQDWQRRPEVTHRLPWSRLQRAMARAWFRDGEVFAQMIVGLRPDLDHGTRVPFSLEAFEAEWVPIDYFDQAKNIAQGIERNAWGKPLAIHALKSDPASIAGPLGQGGVSTKRIPWERMLHLATLDHIGQLRGVSEFASVITRLEDIKDYEESERVAAKIAAMLCGYVKKGTPEDYNGENATGARELAFRPGMIFDDLAPGEDVGMIDSSRPNPNLITFRQGQLRAVAAGLGASAASISNDYEASYAAMRQMLVEVWGHYATLADEFTGEVVQPTWEAFVQAAHLSRVVPMPAELKPGTESDALYIAQQMPWIDPFKEAAGYAKMLDYNLISEPEVIRKRGANPNDVIEQRADFRKRADERGLPLSGAAPSAPAPADPGTGESA